MQITRNTRARALYTGTIGAYVEASTSRIDANHDVVRLEIAAQWLQENNPLVQRYAQDVIRQRNVFQQ